MKIIEYRIIMPLTVEEYHKGLLYTTIELSRLNTSGGEGVEILSSERAAVGHKTVKVYHMKSKVPPFLRVLVPKNMCKLKEESLNAFPYTKTLLTNPSYEVERSYILAESQHLPDRGRSENALQLPEQALKLRKVVFIDIANDPFTDADYKHHIDPSTCSSKLGKRGPLSGNWAKTCVPFMTCYKLVTVEFNWFGLQRRIEAFLVSCQRRLITTFHRHMFCWMDKWYPLTLKELKQREDRLKPILDAQRSLSGSSNYNHTIKLDDL